MKNLISFSELIVNLRVGSSGRRPPLHLFIAPLVPTRCRGLYSINTIAEKIRSLGLTFLPSLFTNIFFKETIDDAIDHKKQLHQGRRRSRRGRSRRERKRSKRRRSRKRGRWEEMEGEEEE